MIQNYLSYNQSNFLEESMMLSIEIKAFFFNALTDYLPYYKQFHFKLTEETTTKSLLEMIHSQNENFHYPKENLVFKINGCVVTGIETLGEITASLGDALQIDSVNSYRSVLGLCINDNDFIESYALLEPYCSDEDLTYYKSLYPLHYASETLNYNRKYIGDAILILAHRLIINQSEHKEEILHIITTAESGLFDCEYENNLFIAQDHHKTIESLKAMAIEQKSPSLCDVVLQKLFGANTSNTNQPEVTYHIKREVESIEGENIVYYNGNNTLKNEMTKMTNEILKAGGNPISFNFSNKRSGVTLLKNNKTLTYTKAGRILLDAIDNGAETMIVECDEDYELFTNHRKSIECIVNRDIPLRFILATDLRIANLNRSI